MRGLDGRRNLNTVAVPSAFFSMSQRDLPILRTECPNKVWGTEKGDERMVGFHV
jgi:hypothetical protein